MLDPDLLHRRATTGDPAALRGYVEAIRAECTRLDGAREETATVAAIPGWTGMAAAHYAARAGGLVDGISTMRNVLGPAAGGMEAAAGSVETAVEAADAAIVPWRERGADPGGLEQLLAFAVSARLVGITSDHDARLAAVAAVLGGDGDEVDIDALDSDTREWVERGLDRTDAWLAGNGSGLGPLIPNTAATGDDRGWIPQGLGYSGATGLLLQSYYAKDGGSYLALVDEAGGTEVNELRLGDEDGEAPGHVGGVTVDDEAGLVHVSSGGSVHTYSLQVLQDAPPGTRVDAVRSSRVAAASYTAFADGLLYVGSHDKNVLHVYRPDGNGGWTPQLDGSGDPVTIDTPDDVQGVVVRDGELVFSTSYGRQNESALVVQDRDTGERSEPYPLPNMSQGIVEVDGQIVTTYESGAEEFDDAGTGAFGWLWGVPDDDGLWASPHMTRTPLSELGLSADEVAVEPQSLVTAAARLGGVADTLRSVASAVAGVRTAAVQLGDVPSAGTASTRTNEVLERCVSLLQAGARATDEVAAGLEAVSSDLTGTDQGVATHLTGMQP
ncbi:hypothetical protein [Nocardioides zeae]|uniref:Uncharacterized protein n=1 Tax=Nocardioides zeae TaxID=1457234 RepID=A0A6P0HPW8_9ACTN|nr:hypothetical protein [Nocardioides zeae]NEN80264.1 hypothetical protein [Nocardioides zeae]